MHTEKKNREIVIQTIQNRENELVAMETKQQKLQSLRDIAAEKQEMNKILYDYIRKVESVSKKSEQLLKVTPIYSFC